MWQNLEIVIKSAKSVNSFANRVKKAKHINHFFPTIPIIQMIMGSDANFDLTGIRCGGVTKIFWV